jgi:PAS domain S-box-containing protein
MADRIDAPPSSSQRTTARDKGGSSGIARRVLVVDRDQTIRSRIAAILRKGGLDVAETDGEATEIPQSDPGAAALVIVRAGEGLGIEGLSRTIRSIPSLADAPILLLLADPSPAARIAALEGGADAWLPHPASPDELLAQTKSLLRRASRLHPPTRDLSRAYHRLQDTLNSITDGFLALDTAWTVREINPAAEKILRVKAPDLLGRSLWEGFPEAVGSRFQQEYEEVLKKQQPARFEEFYPPLNSWLEAHAYPTPEGLALYFRDITVRRQAEQALRDSEAKYRTLFESIDDGFCVIEMLFDENDKPVDYRFLETNPTFERQTGLVNAVGKSARELVPSLDEFWFTTYGNVALTGESARFENHAPAMDRWFDVYAYRPDARKRIVALLFKDITARKQAEAALRRTEAQRSAIIEHAPVGIYLVDSNLRLRQVNPTARPVFGTDDDLIGRDLVEVFHRFWPPDLAHEIARIFRHTLKTGQSHFQRGFAGVRTDRQATEYYDWEVHRVTFPDGQHGVACYFIDISDHLSAQLKAEEGERRLRFMAESLPQKIFTARPDGQVDYLNRQWGEFTGQPIEQLQGWGWTNVLHLDEKEKNLRRWKEALQSGQPFEVEHRFRRHDGAYCWHLIRAQAMHDSAGKITMWIGSTTDIDDQKRAEERLEKVVAERTGSLREAVAELEHFSYTITHDMRAPLRALQSFGQILREEHEAQLDEEGRDYLLRIVRAAERMDHLITDALNYSQVVQQEMPLEPVDCASLLRGMLDSYLEFQPPNLEIRVADDIPTVLGNRAGLTQCFSNLLTNAVKFVTPGEVPQVHVWGERKGDLVRLWVEDRGIGIEAEQQRRIFGMFQRLSNRYEGTGIGLALVQKVVKRMRGQVGVDSSPGEGSRFWIELEATDR